jgi:hypothetical protein
MQDTENRENTLVDKIFRDSNGNIVIAQTPNPPLILWVVARCTGKWLVVYLGVAGII